jgi:hypothetical protein
MSIFIYLILLALPKFNKIIVITMNRLHLKCFFLIILFLNCSKSNLEKLNSYLEKEEYEKLLEFSYKKKSSLTEEELYISSVGISKFQNFLRKNKTEEKYTNQKYLESLEKKLGIKIKLINTDNGKLATIDDIYERLISNKYYKNKCLLDKYKYTFKSNETTENSFLLTDILEIDPRLFLQEFKTIWIEAMKLGIPSSLSSESKEKFIKILHFLASKEETDLKKFFFVTEGTNVNLRSGPGTENANLEKLNKDEVFQIDSDFNTTTIGNKTGKWIQIYVWRTDTAGWIFSPFLKNIDYDSNKAIAYEREISEQTNFTAIDFNEWDPEQIPDGFYGNYSSTKKEIVDANVGFTVYPSKREKGICKKIKKETKKISISFMSEENSEKVILFYLKGVLNNLSTTLVRLAIKEDKIYLDEKVLDIEFNKKKIKNIELNISKESDSHVEFSISANNKEFFETSKINRSEIDFWEICIPQGNKSSSKAILFSFTIY